MRESLFQKKATTDFSKRTEIIYDQNAKIIQQNKEILDRLSNGGQALAENRLYQPLKGLPLRTVDEFQASDDENNKLMRKKLYDHLILLGGSRVRDFLSYALKEMMTDELVCQFKWFKCKGSAQFGDTRVSNVLYKAVRDCPSFLGPHTKKEYKDEILEVLRVTKGFGIRKRSHWKKVCRRTQPRKIF